MLVFFLLGATFGAVEVAVPVAAEDAGRAGAAGLLLGIWGAGSLLGGLAAARAGAAPDPVRRLGALLAALAAGHLLLVTTTGPLLLAGLLLVAGLALSPAMAVAYAMVDGLAPAGAVTEAYTWLATGIAGGLAAGAALAGALAEADGAGAAFALAGAACAARGALAGTAGRATLRPRGQPSLDDQLPGLAAVVGAVHVPAQLGGVQRARPRRPSAPAARRRWSRGPPTSRRRPRSP